MKKLGKAQKLERGNTIDVEALLAASPEAR
jgi:hypothetical protein